MSRAWDPPQIFLFLFLFLILQNQRKRERRRKRKILRFFSGIYLDAMTPSQRKHVLGAQGNMWTVFTHTGELIDLMTYPRACALSETTWSPRAVKDWADFQRRLAIHTGRLERQGINYYRETLAP